MATAGSDYRYMKALSGKALFFLCGFGKNPGNEDSYR